MPVRRAILEYYERMQRAFFSSQQPQDLVCAYRILDKQQPCFSLTGLNYLCTSKCGNRGTEALRYCLCGGPKYHAAVVAATAL